MRPLIKKTADKKKDRTITVRCTPEMEKKIKAKADRLEINVSRFIMDEIENGLKRMTKRDRNNIRALVEVQESMNKMISGLKPEQKEMRQELIYFSQEMMKLWQY